MTATRNGRTVKEKAPLVLGAEGGCCVVGEGKQIKNLERQIGSTLLSTAAKVLSRSTLVPLMVTG